MRIVVLKGTEVIALGNISGKLACNFNTFLKADMLAIQSDVAKYHCFYMYSGSSSLSNVKPFLTHPSVGSQ